MVAVIDKKLVFGREQVLTSTQASKNFGEARRRARREPQFVSDRNDGIDTVIVGFDEFEAMAVALARLAQDPAAARAQGSEGRTLVEQRFSLPAMVGAHRALYDELLRRA